MSSIIDLHGMDESQAIGKIQMFLMEFEESGYDQAEIITGNGIVLKDLAIELVSEAGYRYRNENNNMGSIIIYR